MSIQNSIALIILISMLSLLSCMDIPSFSASNPLDPENEQFELPPLRVFEHLVNNHATDDDLKVIQLQWGYAIPVIADGIIIEKFESIEQIDYRLDLEYDYEFLTEQGTSTNFYRHSVSKDLKTLFYRATVFYELNGVRIYSNFRIARVNLNE